MRFFNYHGPVKECNVKVLSYYNITITTKSTMALNIVRRYQNNMIERQKEGFGSTYIVIFPLRVLPRHICIHYTVFVDVRERPCSAVFFFQNTIMSPNFMETNSLERNKNN
jgi:hypothetical protein